jgi:NDP-sugar pyrophosphorylase family protein
MTQAMSLSRTEVLLLAGGRGTRMRRGERREFQVTPKIFLGVEHRGKVSSLFMHCLSGIASLNPGAISVLGSRHPDSGPDLLLHEVSVLNTSSPVRILWDPIEKELGTAGAVYQAIQESQFETVAVATADTMFPFRRFGEAVDYHINLQSAVTWVATTRPGAISQNTGYLLVNHEMDLVASKEGGGTNAQGFATPIEGAYHATSTGVAIFDARVLRRFLGLLFSTAKSLPVDIYRDLMPVLLNAGCPIRVFDVREPAPDLGTPDRFMRFQRAGCGKSAK